MSQVNSGIAPTKVLEKSKTEVLNSNLKWRQRFGLFQRQRWSS